MSFKYKIGRNDPCLCGSNKKFKKCCIDRIEELKKEQQEKRMQSYINGHELSNEHVEYMSEWFLQQSEYKDFKVIDVSNIITTYNQTNMLMENMDLTTLPGELIRFISKLQESNR